MHCQEVKRKNSNFIYAMMVGFLACGNNSFSQSLDETIAYINSRVSNSAEYREYIHVSSIGEISIYREAPRNITSGASIYTMSPFDVEVIQDKYDTDGFKIDLDCKSHKQCISVKGSVTKYGGPSAYSISLRATSTTADQVEYVRNAVKHLIEIAKEIYSKDQMEKAKTDPFISGQNWGNRVQMTKIGNLYEVPVELNGVLKIKFLLDTGASDVFISPDVLLTLSRSGTLKETDFAGTSIYNFANGKTEECKRYMLKAIKVGNREVLNIVCAVANNINVDMLLGQSFLKRLGSYKIDNATSQLILE